MRCIDVMRREVITCHEDDTVLVAARQMRDGKVGFIPVRGRAGNVIGAITDRDIAVRVCAAGKDPVVTRVGDVMTQEVHFCQASDPVTEAEESMARHKVRRIMVMDEKVGLVGVVSLSDLSGRDWSWRVARTAHAVAGT
jgi:CBS domain-containing protein